MGQYFVRRILGMILVLFIVSIVTFALMHQVPGGPFDRERPLPPLVQENMRKRYNLDDPLYVQYLSYMRNAIVPTITSGEWVDEVDNDYLINISLGFGDKLHFRWMNFGPSMTRPSRTVNDVFRDNLPISGELGMYALLVASAIGIPLGVAAALRKNSLTDYVSMGVAVVGVSLPIIVMGPLLRYIVGVQLGWLPPTGWGEPEHAILPAFALGFSNSALLARLTRASLLQVLNEDYIRTARAKGLPEQVTIWRHAMKNAMIPVVTVLGPLFAFLVTGTVVTEQVFAIPGMGKFFIQSVTNRDYSVIMGTILLFSSFLVIANFVVDLVYAVLDPRIRFE
ncbi:MAG: ABC transporter permease [Anaerolineae bacterium]|nr:ABC transporter permease [Anaerolineae bacterium]